MKIDSYTLSTLCGEFGYVLDEEKTVIFAVRGSLPQEVLNGHFQATAAFREYYESRYMKLNYTTSRCTIGLWDLKTHKIALFPGSTVPSRSYLLRNKAALETFNILSPGKYELRKGVHPREIDGYQRHDALLMDDYGLISRPEVSITGNRLRLRLKNASSKVALAGDNLHASRTEPEGTFLSDNHKCMAALNMHFSSSGCMTIVGQPKEYVTGNDGTWNSWMRFTELLSELESGNNTKFSFLLFNYADFAKKRKQSDLLPIRYGASGNHVKSIQRILTSVSSGRESKPYYLGPENGHFTDETVTAMMAFQKDFFKSHKHPPDLRGFLRNTRHFM